MLHRPRSEDFPDSAYAGELARAAPASRFAPALEAEYLNAHLARVRHRARAWFSLATLLSIGFTLNELRASGIRHPGSLAQLMLLMPSVLILLWLTWSKHYQRYYMPAARFLATLYFALTAIFVAQALAIGRLEVLAALTINLVAIFFFTGLMFRQALLATVVSFLAFTVTAYAEGLEGFLFLKSMGFMSLASIAAAYVYYDVERAYRTSFLEGGLLAELVARDALSGLMNRRAFDEHLPRVWQQALRDQRSLAVLMIDIDHFKMYNDNFGHQAGDAALRSVAREIRDFARRPLDLAARYGGEEFALILYDLAPPHVQDIAERLRESVQKLELKPGGAARTEITVSVGIGLAIPLMGRTPQGLLQLADEALFEAKRAGRNRVVFKGLDAYTLLETGAFKSPTPAAKLTADRR